MIDIERFICSRMRQFENIPEANNAIGIMDALEMNCELNKKGSE